MLRAVVAVMVIASSAHADALFSAGAGAIVEPVRYKGPGDLDPREIELSDTATGAAIPFRVTWIQDQREPHALGITAGFTLGLADARLAEGSNDTTGMLELMGRVGVYRAPSWSLQLGAGGALELPLGSGGNSKLSNTNVEPFTRLAGGTASLSVTWFHKSVDLTFDLRGGVLVASYMRATPVLVTVSAELGRD